MPKSRLVSVSCCAVRLLLWTMLISQSISAPAQKQLIRRQTSTADRLQSTCQRISGTCRYYKYCLDAQFPCGSSGFVLQYAKHHCNAIGRLDLSSSGCPTCLGNEALWDWLHKVNECVQDGLTSLIDEEFKDVTADKVSCLSYEQRAIDKINSCYRRPYDENLSDRSQLCQVLGDHISPEVQQDLKNIVSALNTGHHYHNSTVDSGIPELVRECGHPEIADSLYIGEPTYRLVFCAWSRELPSPVISNIDPIDNILNFMSRNLSDARSRFHYGGLDLTDTCQHTPHSSQDNGQYHIVTWFASANNTAAREWNKTDTIIHENQVKYYIGFFELMNKTRVETFYGNIRDSSKCGDGVRNPGELCDYAMINSPACSFDCNIRHIPNQSQYECSVDRLHQSYCWIQHCGDGKRTSGEECDDGNEINGDGCNEFCQIEPQYQCGGTYNSTTHCRLLPSTIAAQQLQTRSNVVFSIEHSEPSTQSNSLFDSRGLSSASSINSRTVLSVILLFASLWTALILA